MNYETYLWNLPLSVYVDLIRCPWRHKHLRSFSVGASLTEVGHVEADDGDEHHKQRHEDADQDDVGRRQAVVVVVIAVDDHNHDVALLAREALRTPVKQSSKSLCENIFVCAVQRHNWLKLFYNKQHVNHTHSSVHTVNVDG